MQKPELTELDQIKLEVAWRVGLWCTRNANNMEVWLAGGFLRDLDNNKPTDDLDFFLTNLRAINQNMTAEIRRNGADQLKDELGYIGRGVKDIFVITHSSGVNGEFQSIKYDVRFYDCPMEPIYINFIFLGTSAYEYIQLFPCSISCIGYNFKSRKPYKTPLYDISVHSKTVYWEGQKERHGEYYEKICRKYSDWKHM